MEKRCGFRKIFKNIKLLDDDDDNDDEVQRCALNENIYSTKAHTLK